jgi:hypothetical protein
MTGDEVGKLLGLMALADNRKPPKDEEGRKAMITFWLSMVGDLAYADAAQAVQEHYQESRDWIMPADIRQRVRRIRDARLKAVPEPVPPPELLEDADAYRKWLRKETKRIADGKPDLRAIGGAS